MDRAMRRTHLLIILYPQNKCSIYSFFFFFARKNQQSRQHRRVLKNGSNAAF